MASNLIIYYSRRGQNYVNGTIQSLDRGNTEQCAAYIQNAVGGDLFEIQTVRAYPTDYTACTEKAQAELRAGERPALTAYLDDIASYDNVFVCGPCWWGTFPMAVFSQLERLDFTGKRVFPLMTHEGSGLGVCERDLRKICAGAEIGAGLAVRGGEAARSEAAVAAWAERAVG